MSDPLAVAQDGHPVGNCLDLVELVRDEDNTDAAFLEFLHLPEKNLGFFFRQNGGRFVHDQNSGVPADGP